MSPPFHYAISSLLSRPKRSVLLAATSALSASLIVAVACSFASVFAAFNHTADLTVGKADVRITHAFGGSVPSKYFDIARKWDGVKLAVARELYPVPVLNNRTGLTTTPRGIGVDFTNEFLVHPVDLADGELPVNINDVIIDPMVAKELKAKVGDTLLLQQIGNSITFHITGIMKRPDLPILQRKEMLLSENLLKKIHRRNTRYFSIDIVLSDKTDPSTFINKHKQSLPRELLLEETERVTSMLRANLASTQISFLVIASLTFMAAAFIILTGMTVSIAEQMRELAILRSLGSGRIMLASTQLWTGLFYGILGSIIGIPLGVGIAYLLYLGFTEYLTAGFHIPGQWLVISAIGTVTAGILGAIYPAYRASSVSPLVALKYNALPPRVRGIVICGIVGLLLILLQPLLLYSPSNMQTSFWLYAIVGIPAMYIGYFLIAVPLVRALAIVFSHLLTSILRLSPGLLSLNQTSSPYQQGFTAGAQMVGLSIMIAIGSSGSSLIQDWIGQLRFPDAFCHAWFGITTEQYEKLKTLDFVENTCATTMFPVEVAGDNIFGVNGLQEFKVNFISFEPDEFFNQTALTWISGDKNYAVRRLKEGGAVIVAREFLIAKNIGVGDTIRLGRNGKWSDFEIVGVVTSPGLNIITRLFGIGEAYLDQAISSVFGSRKDAVNIFNNNDINLIQINIKDGYDEEKALSIIRKIMQVQGLTTGSSKQARDMINKLSHAMIVGGSATAFLGILIASLGAGNIILANLYARRFEYGVLVSLGARRIMLVRTLIAETILLALTASVLGIAAGLQGANSDGYLYRMFGLDLSLHIPGSMIITGCSLLAVLTFIFAIPAMRFLIKTPPRELLQNEG